ncbi:alpha/beta hydrolase [Sinosporangium album]|uniref:alpha/beta hydrolase n=1 Tax=Sinosporangium album TaxID=504805 RepID=UPI001FDF7308|nr:alpha/beta hydrolase [Sinosporangium album]
MALTTVAIMPTAAQASSTQWGEPTPPPPPVTSGAIDPPPGTSVTEVSYGPHRRQKMDIWWPTDGGQKRPGVFLIHGGWWSSGDKKYMTEITRSYTELGYTVFNLNYRLSGDAAWPAQRVDALDAIATARRHAARWAFDPDNYVIVGFSAGGHVAASVGTYGNGVPGLKGVVGVSPVVSPLRAYQDGADTLDPLKVRLRDAAIRLAGGCEPKGRCSRVWASMEVSWHASRGDAPMFSVHSEDEFVPPRQSMALKSALNKAGVNMTVRSVPGTVHSSPLYRTFGVADEVQRWISRRVSDTRSDR